MSKVVIAFNDALQDTSLKTPILILGSCTKKKKNKINKINKKKKKKKKKDKQMSGHQISQTSKTSFKASRFGKRVFNVL